MRIPAAGENSKFAVFGALDHATGRIAWPLGSRKDGPAFVAFLDHLLAAYPTGSVVVVLDNVGYPKGRLAKDWWLAHQDRVRPLWLPAYAPELNPVEHVWGRTKYTDLANFVPDQAEHLRREVEASLAKTRGRQTILRSFFSHAKLEL